MSEFTTFTLAGGRSSPLIIVPTYVNGRGPYNFILDTGASQSLISFALASSLGIRSQSEEQAFGAGGAVQISCARVDSIAVGLARQENAPISITNELEQVGVLLKLKVDGDLGFSFMKDFRVTIDYQRSVLHLVRAGGRVENNQDATVIPFSLASTEPLIVVDAFVNDEGPFQFAVDTGTGRTVLTPELAKRLNIPTAKEIKGAGVGGAMQLTGARVDSLSLCSAATVRNHDVVVGAFLNSISAAAGTKLDGIVGHNFLSQFQLTIDYAENQLTFLALLGSKG